MVTKRLLFTFLFLVTMLWLSSNIKKAHSELAVEEFNTYVRAKVVDLPLCGASNIITVEYDNKRYDVSVSKNECIQGKYRIGDYLNVMYNSRLDRMNAFPLGSYRLNMFFLCLVGVLFLIYLYIIRRR